MVKTHNKLMIFIALIVFISFIFSNVVLALDNPDFYDPSKDTGSASGTGVFLEKAGNILGIIQVIGIIVAIAMLMIIGIKYIFGGVENKAEYKKTLLPYLIGFIMVVAIITVLEIIEGFVQ